MKNITSLINSTINPKQDSDQCLLILYSICLSLKCKNILELGVRNINTTIPLIEAAKINNGHVFSVDINLPKNDNNLILSKKHWTFNQIDSIKFLTNQVKKRNKYDFIFIDDWHSYDHVKKELELIDKLSDLHTIILIHDTMYGYWQPHYHCDLTLNSGQWANGGPYRAVAELDKNIWEFSTIPVQNGLTILRKKHSSYNT